MPKDSDVGIAFDIFMIEIKECDKCGYTYGKAYNRAKEYSIKTGKWIRFSNEPSSSPNLKSLKDLNIQALNIIKELNYPIKKAILDHIKKLSNNDVTLVLRKTEQGYYVLVSWTDTMNYEYTKKDENSILTRYDCCKWNNPDCKPITLPWQEAAFFFIISKESGDAFLAFYKIPVFH